jgi:1-deoxyxylulose-5-phosphate synthase
MESRILGGSGFKVPVLSLGTGTFGGRGEFFKAWGGSGVEEATRLVDVCLEAGLNMFDTADVYSAGLAEEILGKAIAGRRDQVIVSTKGSFRTGPGPNDIGSSRFHLTQTCEASLRRLGTDYVDLYQLHHPDHETPMEETLRALDDVVRAGKARYVGCSNYHAYQVARALGKSEARGLVRFDSVQPRYNLLFRQIERELLPFCEEEGVGVIPYNPLAGGLLSGKHRREAGPTAGTRFTLGTAGGRYRERYWHEREFETVEALRLLAAEAGMSMAQMAVAWTLGHPAITAPIIGASRADQLADVLAAADKDMPGDLKARLDELTREYRFGDDPR